MGRGAGGVGGGSALQTLEPRHPGQGAGPTSLGLGVARALCTTSPAVSCLPNLSRSQARCP